MRKPVIAATAAVTSICLTAGATAAQASTAQTPNRDQPSWYTSSFEQKLHDAGAQGIQLSSQQLSTSCRGYAAKGVGANGCIIGPGGCTANFIFTDGSSMYIGTARHCVDAGAAGGDDVGVRLVMQVDTTTIAEVGSVVRETTGDGLPGNDFALVKIDPDVVAKWGVDPAIPVVGGPNGVYTGCGPVGIQYYGHGHVTHVGPGRPGFGIASNWNNDGYGWTGSGVPGDSGSGVVTSTGEAAGDLTHGIRNNGTYPDSTTVGMRATAILRFLGPGYRLVNADGSTSTATATNC